MKEYTPNKIISIKPELKAAFDKLTFEMASVEGRRIGQDEMIKRATEALKEKEQL